MHYGIETQYALQHMYCTYVTVFKCSKVNPNIIQPVYAYKLTIIHYSYFATNLSAFFTNNILFVPQKLSNHDKSNLMCYVNTKNRTDSINHSTDFRFLIYKHNSNGWYWQCLVFPIKQNPQIYDCAYYFIPFCSFNLNLIGSISYNLSSLSYAFLR